jgi:hypothetical protein
MSVLRMMEGEEAGIGTELRSRFNSQTATTRPAEEGQRTVGELLAAARTRGENRRLEENRNAAQTKAEQERLAAIAREKHLDSVAGRVPALWSQVEELIGTKQPKSYDLVVQLLLDLRDLAKRHGNETDSAGRVASLRDSTSSIACGCLASDSRRASRKNS